jgi:hypothetical protein
MWKRTLDGVACGLSIRGESAPHVPGYQTGKNIIARGSFSTGAAFEVSAKHDNPYAILAYGDQLEFGIKFVGCWRPS